MYCIPRRLDVEHTWCVRRVSRCSIFVISGWCTIKKLLKISNDEDKDTEDDTAARKEGRITIFIGHMLMRSVVYIYQRRIKLTINELMIIGLQ